jgi:hypothetical protein
MGELMTAQYRYWIPLGFLWATLAGHAEAQSEPTYIQFVPNTAKGALYRPDSGEAPHVAILTIHRTQNYMGYDGCPELSARGYLVLCMNSRSENNEAKVMWEQSALDVKAGVKFLRAQPGITKVLFWGWGNGGEITSFYQAVAENGLSYCQGQNKLSECGSELLDLPPADGLILVETARGNAVTILRRLNGAVINDAEIIANNALPQIDPDLDPFSPDNGYNPLGTSSYSEEFQSRYFAAQARRMNKLIEIAQAKLDAIEDRGEPYPDDDVFIIVRGQTAGLLFLDPRIHHSTLHPQKLLLNDGTVDRRIVENLRPAQPERADRNRTFSGGTLVLTLRSFLSSFATRANDSMDDIDYCSSNNSVSCAVKEISVPLLVTAMQGNSFLRFNEMHYDHAKSEDKDYVIIEGATHTAEPCIACEDSPGQYSNAKANFFDYVRDWIDERY